MFTSLSSGIEGGIFLVDEDATAENTDHFTRILGRLWLAPFTNFGVAEAIEGVNGAIDDFGSTDDQDFEGDSIGFWWSVGWERRFRVSGLIGVGNKVFCHWDFPAFVVTAMFKIANIFSLSECPQF
jgi:hypothetical protein